MTNSIIDRVADWIYSNMKKDASLTMESVICKSEDTGKENTDGMAGCPEMRSELYFHLSRRKTYCEICVSYPMNELEKRFETMEWQEVVRILRVELGNAGLLKMSAVNGNRGVREETKDFGVMSAAGPIPVPAEEFLPDRYEERETRTLYIDNKEKKVRTAKEIMEEMDGPEKELFEDLRTLRREISAEKGVAPYVVFSNRALAAMSREKPDTIEKMKMLPGVGVKNSSAYGKQFLQIIREHAGKTDHSSSIVAGGLEVMS